MYYTYSVQVLTCSLHHHDEGFWTDVWMIVVVEVYLYCPSTVIDVTVRV